MDICVYNLEKELQVAKKTGKEDFVIRVFVVAEQKKKLCVNFCFQNCMYRVNLFCFVANTVFFFSSQAFKKSNI